MHAMVGCGSALNEATQTCSSGYLAQMAAAKQAQSKRKETAHHVCTQQVVIKAMQAWAPSSRGRFRLRSAGTRAKQAPAGGARE